MCLAFFVQNLFLQTQLLYIGSHVLEVHSNGWLLHVFNLFGANHCEFSFERWRLIVCCQSLASIMLLISVSALLGPSIYRIKLSLRFKNVAFFVRVV